MTIKLVPLTFLLVLASATASSSSLVSEENVKWTEWKRLYAKSYADAYEENFRRAIWHYNLKVRVAR
jgi:high-affinity Fe2+/Pb2+ permease